MTRIVKTLIATALLSSAAFAAQADTLVLNGSFEATNIGSAPWTYLSAVTGWQSSLAGGSAFEIQKGATQGGLSGFNSTAFDGKQYLELNTTQFTTVSQNLATHAGNSYSLSFAYSGRPDTANHAASAVEVFWGGQKIFSTTAGAQSGWHLYTIDNLKANGNSTLLSFASIAPSSSVSYGSYLDAVQVSTFHPTTAPIPEPGTWALMLTGLLAMGMLVRQRRNVHAHAQKAGPSRHRH